MRSFKARLEPGQILMPLHHLAHDDQGGRVRPSRFDLLRQSGQDSDMDALLERGALFDQGRREIGRQTVGYSL